MSEYIYATTDYVDDAVAKGGGGGVAADNHVVIVKGRREGGTHIFEKTYEQIAEMIDNGKMVILRVYDLEGVGDTIYYSYTTAIPTGSAELGVALVFSALVSFDNIVEEVNLGKGWAQVTMYANNTSRLDYAKIPTETSVNEMLETSFEEIAAVYEEALSRWEYYGTADIEPTDPSEFTFDAETGTVIRYNGDETSVVIPYAIDGVRVTALMDNDAYLDGSFVKSNVTDITIPNCVTSIGMAAFRNCTGLTSINIPDAVTSISSQAFYGCSKLTSISIPEGITSINESVFYNCSSLKSITMPESVTSIGNSAFYGCSGLTSIKIPDGVTSIGTDAFNGCSSLKSINIPKGVTLINEGSFASCSSLKSIEIPDGVTKIGSAIGTSAFSGCTKIKEVVIPGSVSMIGGSGSNWTAPYGTSLGSFHNDVLFYVEEGSVAEKYCKKKAHEYKYFNNVNTITLNSPSGSKYKITIDDNGNLNATIIE